MSAVAPSPSCRRLDMTDLGPVAITAAEGAIISMDFLPPDTPLGNNPREPLLEAAFTQLREYLAGQRQTFELPLAPVGTAFQKHIWTLLTKIPFGAVATYGEIAARAGRPNAARAVGSACHCNPIPVFIPCHRVVAAGGRLGGFGLGLELKQRLLDLEGATAGKVAQR
ncbi:MAG: methylated-DNA--[protein]-cysteine S-methyltransferase [Lentisphaerae bacterium]|nr:methylated-DNA--[protein]-cysteine S-methyltransferase [Lentisphaerota bacterium]